MIIGGCPYCDGPVINWMPEHTPKYGKATCEHCGKTYWMEYSRVQPKAYTIEDFTVKYTVDDITMTVHERNPPPPLTAMQQEVVRMIAERIAEDWQRTLIEGK